MLVRQHSTGAGNCVAITPSDAVAPSLDSMHGHERPAAHETAAAGLGSERPPAPATQEAVAGRSAGALDTSSALQDEQLLSRLSARVSHLRNAPASASSSSENANIADVAYRYGVSLADQGKATDAAAFLKLALQACPPRSPKQLQRSGLCWNVCRRKVEHFLKIRGKDLLLCTIELRLALKAVAVDKVLIWCLCQQASYCPRMSLLCAFLGCNKTLQSKSSAPEASMRPTTSLPSCSLNTLVEADSKMRPANRNGSIG